MSFISLVHVYASLAANEYFVSYSLGECKLSVPLLRRSMLLRSQHGESAYIIEEGWNLTNFRSYLIGRCSSDCVTLNNACQLGYESSR